MSRTAIWVLLSCALLMACKQQSYGNTPVRQRGVGPIVAPQPTAAKNKPQEPLSPELLPLRVDETPQAEEAEPTSGDTLPVAEAMPAEKPVRNLQHELESMIGSPVDCIAPRAAANAPPQLRLSLSASVMPSGAVGRGEVSASSELTKPELDCVRGRLEALHFAAPIDNAPLTVSGSITLNYGS